MGEESIKVDREPTVSSISEGGAGGHAQEVPTGAGKSDTTDEEATSPANLIAVDNQVLPAPVGPGYKCCVHCSDYIGYHIKACVWGCNVSDLS